MERVILTTGGTGGHIFPALATAEELKRQNPAIQILFMGSFYGPEKRLAEQAGIPFEGLEVRGLLGRGLRAFTAAYAMMRAVMRARKILHSFAPEIVAGFGGYAAFAPMCAARLGGIPSLLHEQNAIAGTSNRVLSRFARKVCLSLAETKGFPEEKCIVTGNPVRQAIVALRGSYTYSGERRLAVLGGSQGGHEHEYLALPQGESLEMAGVCMRSQTVQQDWAMDGEAYVSGGYDASCVQPFIDDMASLYTWADVVLCRSGASTVAELAAAGKPSVFVPFPQAIHDHQTCNARVMAQQGAAFLVPEGDMETTDVCQLLIRLFDEPETLVRMSEVAAAQAKTDAAARIVIEMEHLVHSASATAGNTF